METGQRFKYKRELILAKKLVIKCYKQCTKKANMDIKQKEDKSLVTNIDVGLEKLLIKNIVDR